MPTITKVITTRSKNVPVDTINTLHTELTAVGLPVVGAETSGEPRFGPAAADQLKLFQDRYKLPVNGELDPATGGILSLSALVAAEPDRAKLRAELANMVNNVPDSPEYNYWLARSALVAGDYGLARRVRPDLVDLSGLSIDLGSLILTGTSHGTPRQPEVPFPENFYNYRHSLMTEEDMANLRAYASSAPPYMARAVMNPEGPGGPPPPPPPPGVPDPPPATTVGMDREQRRIASALAFLNAIEAWQLGNSEFANQRYASAVQAYNSCQLAVLDYFSLFPDYNLTTGYGPIRFIRPTLASRIDELVWRLASDQQTWAGIWAQINWRRQLLSLAELGQFDWTPFNSGSTAYLLLKGNLGGTDQPATSIGGGGLLDPGFRKASLDTPLFVIAAVLVPLARAEANHLRRQYADARAEFTRILRTTIPPPLDIRIVIGPEPTAITVSLLCEFIEVPFVRLLLLETMLDQAEEEYKSRLSADDETDPATNAQELERITQIAQGFIDDNIPGDVTPDSLPLQHLVAAITYADAMANVQDDGTYVASVKQALKTLNDNVVAAVSSGDVGSVAFRSLGQTITVPNFSAIGDTLPGLTSGTHPHEPYLQFNPPDAQPIRERNPRVYARLLQAQSRLLQIWSGFNYLGYRDDYVPPWRFQYLLDRARYFSEHAKNAQRDYLNFLNNAENEEYKEMSAAQNVEMEKANVQIESARIDQSTKEVAASQQSAKLAELNAADAQQRVTNYKTFSDFADQLLDTGRTFINQVPEGLSGAGKMLGVESLDAIGTGAGDFFTGGFVSNRKNNLVASAQRGVELANLELAANEANQSKNVANAQLAVAQAGLVVAGLQRQAALLRHEFALQNLQFMRNQVLNTEQWYRLAEAIRSVSDTYLRYGIQIAFLAQQAYNFEDDKRLNIIRFDYDLSDMGSMLAADFLLRDLDTLEEDLVVSQDARLQPVKYVLSLAREYSETLSDLAENGEVGFGIRLEQLERHFPGLLNLRIVSVDLLPVAVMDPTRVSVELTHLGSGMVRLKSQPGTSPLNTSDLNPGDDWLADSQTDWPIKIHISGPETTVFTGLSRQEAAGANVITANERGAFEGLPGASSWEIDLSAKENQIVPGTLADVLITFTLSGYHDPTFRDVVATAASAKRPFAATSYLSVRSVLPDSYYSLVHYGKLNWEVSDGMLSLVGSPNELRNLAVILALVPDGPEIGRCYCRYPIRINVTSGGVDVTTALPEFTMTPSGLTLSCVFTGPSAAQLTWDFGDSTPLVQGASVQHSYARPGCYEVLARLVTGQSLVEYRSAVVVSANHVITAPFVVTPSFSAGTAGGDGLVPLTVSVPDASDISIACSAGSVRSQANSGPVVLNLASGSYTLDFIATRKLNARFYSKQRYLPDQAVDLYRGRIATNRTFDLSSGVDTTTSPSAFTTQLFGNGNVVLSPVDRWTLELPLADNPWFTNVSPSDIAEFDGGELADAILSLEFLRTQ